MIELASFIGVAAISGAGWFGIILLIDANRGEKGSTRSLAASLLFGFASIPLVLVVYRFAPDLVSGIESLRMRELAEEILVVGPVEEFAKFFIFFLVVVKRKPVQEPLDAMLHAAAVALAFSLVENVEYGLSYGIEIVAVRALLSTPGHMTLACIWGFAYAVLIHANPRRTARDFIILFFSIYPAALLHGLSNFLLGILGAFTFLFDGALLFAAFSLLLWIRSMSPFRSFSFGEAASALSRIDLSLASNDASFPLHLRAAQMRAALGDLPRARRHIDQCLRLKKGDAFALALFAMILILQGEAEKGEEILLFSYPSLSAERKLTLGRLSRHIARSRKTGNAYNEFLLAMSVRDAAPSMHRRKDTP
jgi:RsiW-degrading membrane proteinase PrsW (M82 family)